MIPLHIENTGRTGAVALQRQAPGRAADAGRVVVEGCGRVGRDQPAGGGGAGLGLAGLAQQQAQDAAGAGEERQAAAGGEVELTGRAADLGEDGGEAAAGKPLGEHPQGVAGLCRADEDQPRRVEAEAVEADAIGETGLTAGGGLDDPQDRTAVVGGETGEDRSGKAGGGGVIAGEGGADLVEGAAAEATGKRAVDRRNVEGKQGFGAAGGVDKGDAVALDLGDPAAQAGKGVPCH